MKLDQREQTREQTFESAYSAEEVAAIAGIHDLKMIANWTDRGLVDPYHPLQGLKRGRGRARQYRFRDVLTFALMKTLSERYEIPIPLGRRICAMVVEDLTPAHVGYVVVANVRANRILIHFFKTLQDLTRHMATDPMEARLIIDTAALLDKVTARATQLITNRASSSATSRGSRASRLNQATERP